jgi:hypothetical protein
VVAGPSAWDEQDVGRKVEQPCERDLRGCGGDSCCDFDEDGTRKNCVLNTARPAQRTERNEGNALPRAVVQYVERTLISKIEEILDTDNLSLVERSLKVFSRNVA